MWYPKASLLMAGGHSRPSGQGPLCHLAGDPCGHCPTPRLARSPSGVHGRAREALLCLLWPCAGPGLLCPPSGLPSGPCLKGRHPALSCHGLAALGSAASSAPWVRVSPSRWGQAKLFPGRRWDDMLLGAWPFRDRGRCT